MQDTIRQFVVENFLAGKNDPGLKNEDSLLEARIIDSTGVMELLEFIEDKWGISVDDSELTPDNFDSVSRVATFVQLKLG
jgi:acyl carrier protein